jgi:serine/threonine protein kinase
MKASELHHRYELSSTLSLESLLLSGQLSIPALDKVMNQEVELLFYLSLKDDMIEHLENDRSFGLQRLYTLFPLTFEGYENMDATVMVVEPSTRGTLNDYIKSYPNDEELKEVIKSLLKALIALEGNYLEPAVISIDHILVTDHADSEHAIVQLALGHLIQQRLIIQSESTTGGRIRNNIAPELVALPKHNENRKSLSWSLGALLFELFTGEHPLDSTRVKRYSREYKTLLDSIPMPYQAIIRRTLLFDSKKRISIREALALLVSGVPTDNSPKEESWIKKWFGL